MNEECECSNIDGYGINGICMKCHNEKIQKVKDDMRKELGDDE